MSDRFQCGRIFWSNQVPFDGARKIANILAPIFCNQVLLLTISDFQKRNKAPSHGPTVMPDNMLISEEAEPSGVTHELEEHTVSVTTISDLDLTAGGLFLGKNRVGEALFCPGMRSRDIFGRLRLRGSIPAPAPSKTFRRLRLRAKCTGSGGSGSGSDAQVLIWALTSNTIFKNVKYQNMTSYWLDLEFECYFEWVPLEFVAHCHPRSVSDAGEVTNSLGLRCLR